MATPHNGTIAVRTNGADIAIKGTITYSLGGKFNEALEGPTGLAGFSVKGGAAFVEIVSIDDEDVDLAALQDLRNQTITLQLENGKTVVVNNASVVGLIEVSAEEGEFTVRFVGKTGKEI